MKKRQLCYQVDGSRAIFLNKIKLKKLSACHQWEAGTATYQ